MTDRCENSLQTLVRWLGGLLSALAVAAVLALVLYGAAWLVVNTVAAVVVMFTGIKKSIRSDNRPVPVGRACLYLCLANCAIPMLMLLVWLNSQ